MNCKQRVVDQDLKRKGTDNIRAVNAGVDVVLIFSTD